MEAHAPIGVIDSGIGGLTIVKELRKLMPSEDIVYAGDTARVPYGPRSGAQIVAFTKQLLNFLQTKRIKLAVIACNTMTTFAYEAVLDAYPFAIVPMDSGIFAALAGSSSKNIGVIATEATVRNEMHAKAARLLDGRVKVYAKACPDFAPLIEAGKVSGAEIENAAAKYLAFFDDKAISSLILGCTHYPLIKETIQKYVKPGVTLIDPAKATAADVFARLKQRGFCRGGRGEGGLDVFFSGDPLKKQAMAQMFLGIGRIKAEGKDFSGCV